MTKHHAKKEHKSASEIKPYGIGMSQDDMMKKDQCILLDNDDHMIGHASKVASHQFNKETPRGLLHRAFSVFLFDNDGRLLLQQRAASKITFPNVWTNTCCSHPLYGYEPCEVDEEVDVAKGNVGGAINAAIRKLEHELGVPTNAISKNSFKYLTRLHYWAADVVTHGKKSPWGEHEIDYILFVKADIKHLLKPNSEEVDDIKYVTEKELKEQMKPSSGLLWSPWFRIIAEQFLPYWWKDLNSTLNTNEWVDWKTIHHFDPTTEHMGGGGDAGDWLGQAKNPFASNNTNNKSSTATTTTTTTTNDSSLKQGAYGKVQIHGHSKFDRFKRIDEVFAAVWYKFGVPMPNKVDTSDPDVKFCDDMLVKVSRSFCAVIRQLPKGLCADIMIFYLALRALDTIEDDMEAFKGKEHVKIDLLNNFYKTGLVTPNWSMDGVGEADEKVLLQNYHHCVNVFNKLSTNNQNIIADITKRMGQGMAKFVEKDLGQGTVKIIDYNEYCHYVAGLVGEGLSRLFTSSGYESPNVAAVATTSANTMGLMLQKTNIIRDYLEDYVDGRAWWPQEIWKLYATKTGDLGELALEENRLKAMECCNHLIMDALQCIPECLEYMKLLKTEEIFRFCAIPQVMAAATLSELYNNPLVFTGVVKIRKFQSAKLILDTKSLDGLHKWFNILVRDIKNKIPPNDPNADGTNHICDEIIKLTDVRATRAISNAYAQAANVVAVGAFALSSYYVFATNGRSSQLLNMVKDGSLSFGGIRGLITSAGSKWGNIMGTSLAVMFGYGAFFGSNKGLKRAD
jgi:farnesyl-diphosphate farnesyltransferase